MAKDKGRYEVQLIIKHDNNIQFVSIPNMTSEAHNHPWFRRRAASLALASGCETRIVDRMFWKWGGDEEVERFDPFPWPVQVEQPPRPE